MNGYCDICGTKLTYRGVIIDLRGVPVTVCPECAEFAEDLFDDEVEYLDEFTVRKDD